MHYTICSLYQVSQRSLISISPTLPVEETSLTERECKGNTLFLFCNTSNILCRQKKPQSNNRFSKRPAGLPYFASAKLLLFIPYIQINTTIKTVKKKLYPKKQRLTSQNYFDKQPFCNKKTKKNMIISWKKVAPRNPQKNRHNRIV